MADIWVCGDCRSVNNPKEKRCYRCGVPRLAGEMSRASASVTTAIAQPPPTVLARVERLHVRYIPTWPLAALTIVLIAAATAIDILHTAALTDAVTPAGIVTADPAVMGRLLVSLAIMGAAYLTSYVIWSIWIALVVANVPAATGTWPAWSSAQAFFAAFLPFPRRPLAVLRNVVHLLTGGRIRPLLFVRFWWLAYLAAQFLPDAVFLFRVRLGDHPTALQAALFADQARIAFLLLAACLAIAVVLTVELAQRRAMASRATTVATVRGQAA